jgi:hypothetical protein
VNRDANERMLLTAAQAAMLARVREHPRVFNARARRTIEAPRTGRPGPRGAYIL